MSNTDLTKLLGNFDIKRAAKGPDVGLVEASLGCMVGQPCLTFYSQETDMAVLVCPIPMLGLDPLMPLAVSYPFQVVGRLQLTKEQAAGYVSAALNEFDMQSVNAHSLLQNTDKVAFRIFVDDKVESVEGTHCYMGTASVELNEQTITQIRYLLGKQLQAYDRNAAHDDKGTLQ
jgi:hypothetical protein